MLDEENYSLKRLDPPDLSHKSSPKNIFNIKSQVVYPFELLTSNYEQDNYYLPLYQGVFHNLRAGNKFTLQRDLMDLD